jgi:hypothetical protein
MLQIKRLLAGAVIAIAAGLLSLALNTAAPAFASNTYPYGQCTYYAKSVRPDIGNHWGNARYWASAAIRNGFPVSNKPIVGDVVVFGAYVQGNSPYGHVGIVTAVSGNQFKVVSMWGNEATGRIHVNWHHTGAGVSFIHKKGTKTAATTTKPSTVSKAKPAATTKPATKATTPATKPKTTAPATKPKTTTPATKPKTTTPATKPKTTAPATKPKAAAPATKPKTTSAPATKPKAAAPATKATSKAATPAKTPAKKSTNK